MPGIEDPKILERVETRAKEMIDEYNKISRVLAETDTGPRFGPSETEAWRTWSIHRMAELDVKIDETMAILKKLAQNIQEFASSSSGRGFDHASSFSRSRLDHFILTAISRTSSGTWQLPNEHLRQ